MKDKIAEVPGLSDISPEYLQHEVGAPNISKTYRKLSMDKSQTDGYYNLLTDYAHSPIRDYESYLRILTAVNEDDFKL